MIDLATAQRADGHEAMVVVLSGPASGDLEPELEQRDIPVHRVPKGQGFSPRMFLRLASLFRRQQIDLVHTHNPMPLIYGAPAAKAVGAKVVHTKHGEHRDTSRRFGLRRAAAQFVDAFVAVSEKTAQFARQHRECDLDKLRVIENGTDLARFAPDAAARREIRAELAIPPQAFVVLSVGRFVPEKNQSALLRACESLLSEEFHLLFAGDGPLFADVEAEVAAMENNQPVHLLGRRTDVPRLMAASDAFALSSRTEGLPVVLLEAMASGLPGGVDGGRGDSASPRRRRQWRAR